MSIDSLRELYDQQLRTVAEVADAAKVTRIGPLWAATYPRNGRGFVTYQAIPPGIDLEILIEAAIRHFTADDRVNHFEWKLRSHDRLPTLAAGLSAHGFVTTASETVMVGPLAAVIHADDGLPTGYHLARATTGALIEEAAALAGQVFDQRTDQVAATAEHLTNRLHNDPDSFEMWFVRDRQGAMVCSGRVEFVEKTDFAGIWGGACSPAHRGRGLYRAITAQRARSALARGKTYLHSDCTRHSHPILERAGLSAITTVIPMIWTRHPTAPHHGQPQPRARVG